MSITRSAVAVILAALALPAAATQITFDFDSMAYRSSSTPGADSVVQTYMQGRWAGAGQAGNVTVTGAGELSNSQYTGDSHVVGPQHCTVATHPVCTTTSLTLGNTDGGVQNGATVETPAVSAQNPDNYIVNYGSDRIAIQLPTLVYSVSFDFEIFPDGTCPSRQNCGGSGLTHLPDFEFLAGTSPATLVTVQTVFGTFPGAAGTFPDSPAMSNGETAPQYLGVSGTIFFQHGVSLLEFVDWPERIGIDNLVLDTVCTQRCISRDVPEPPVVALAALALALMGVARLGRRRAGD